MLSAKQGNYWYHFYNVFGNAVLDWGLNPGPPALDASALPLGYRGGSYKPYDLEFNHTTICVLNVFSEVPNALNVYIPCLSNLRSICLGVRCGVHTVF